MAKLWGYGHLKWRWKLYQWGKKVTNEHRKVHGTLGGMEEGDHDHLIGGFLAPAFGKGLSLAVYRLVSSWVPGAKFPLYLGQFE